MNSKTDTKLSGMERALLKAEAMRTVGAMNYEQICAIVPRGVHWWESSGEEQLERLQRNAAVNCVFKQLLKEAENE